MTERTSKLITEFHAMIPELNRNQVKIVLDIVTVLSDPFEHKRAGDTWLFNQEMVDTLADFVRIHHALSDEPFTKDKFEYALDRSCKILGLDSQLPGRTNPGHDIRIGLERVSLKTQADLSIRCESIHISKFMELGKGKWENISDLERFRDKFLEHMIDYERIVTLRCLSSKAERDEGLWNYEIVEIPKALFKKANNGTFEMKTESRQDPKPGYCYVRENGVDLYQLYFDGGSERKLQIKNLLKSNCHVLAEFSFRKK